MDNNECINESKDKPTRTLARPIWVKTIALVVVWISMGMSNVLTPTVLPDIRKRLDVNVEQISRALAIGGLGALIGAPLGSVADRYNKKVDFILSVCLFVCAFSIGTRCLTTNLTLFTIELFVDGASWPLINSAGNSLLMDMWGEKGRVPMHALHFGYPLGAMLGPLIAYPFVSEEAENKTTDWNNTSVDVLNATGTLQRKYKDDSQIEIPFGIVGCFIAILAITFLMFQFFIPASKISSSHNKDGLNWKGVFLPSKWAEGDSKFGVILVIIVMIFYALHVASIKGPDIYGVTYAVDYIGYTNQEAALFSSIINVAGTFGRAAAIIFARFVPIQIMLISEVHGVAVSSVIMLIWGLDNKLMYLVFNCFFSFFLYPVWPSTYTWTDQYIALYAIVVGLTDIAAKGTNILFSWFLGYLYTYTVPNSLFYNTVVASVLHCVLVIVMNIFAEKHGRRNKRSGKSENHNLTHDPKVFDGTSEMEKLNASQDDETTVSGDIVDVISVDV